MGMISMILRIAAIILGVLGIIGTGLTSILSLTAVGTYGVPILVVSGIILGSIAMVKNTDAEQKNEDVQGYYVQYWVLFSIL